jgi:hypothetical protein
MKKKLQKRVDNIYSDASKEGRVTNKWGNEYRLFVLISNYIEGAYYQYYNGSII